MASLQKKGGSWYCQFKYQQKRHTVTIGKVEETEAKVTAARIDYLLMRIRQRLLEVPAGVDIGAFIEHDGKPPAVQLEVPVRVVTTYSELRDAYLQTFSHGAIESNTLYTSKIHLEHLAQTLGKKFQMDKLELADLQKHVDRRQREVSATTIKKEIDTLRVAWNWACRMKLTKGPFPSPGLVYPKTDEKLPFMTVVEVERRLRAGADPNALWECLYLTHGEIADLLDQIHERDINTWIYPAFVFTAHTGARRSEMMRARTEDVDFESCTITIREKKRKKGQRTTRRVPMTVRLLETLKSWLADRNSITPLFSNGPQPLTPQTAQNSFERAVKGSRWQVMRGWHVLRHSFISALASRGVDQRIIDDFVGHQTEQQRRRYRHLYPSTQQEAIRGVFD